MSSNKMAHPILAAGLIVIVAMSGVGYYLYQAGYFNPVTSTGISFQACNNHADGTQDCNSSTNVPFQDVAQTAITSVSLKGATGSFTYKGTPKSWSFACSGTISFGNGQNAPLTASASGSGSPPPNWPISVSPKQWNLSTIYGSSYGQKNLTAQLGSTASPCSLAVALNEVPYTITKQYHYASVAKWSVNYQASSTTSVSSTSITTSVGNTVTTSQKNIWNTTATASTNGATGNSAPNGVLVTLAPDYATPSQSLAWAFIPASFANQCQGGLQYNCNAFINLLTPTSSISVTYPIGSIPSQGLWISALFSTQLAPSTLYIVNVLFAGNANLNNPTSIFNQVVPISAPISGNTVPSPFTSQYQSWLTPQAPSPQTPVCTINGSPYYSYRICSQSVVSVQF